MNDSAPLEDDVCPECQGTGRVTVWTAPDDEIERPCVCQDPDDFTGATTDEDR